MGLTVTRANSRDTDFGLPRSLQDQCSEVWDPLIAYWGYTNQCWCNQSDQFAYVFLSAHNGMATSKIATKLLNYKVSCNPGLKELHPLRQMASPSHVPCVYLPSHYLNVYLKHRSSWAEHWQRQLIRTDYPDLTILARRHLASCSDMCIIDRNED